MTLKLLELVQHLKHLAGKHNQKRHAGSREKALAVNLMDWLSSKIN